MAVGFWQHKSEVDVGVSCSNSDQVSKEVSAGEQMEGHEDPRHVDRFEGEAPD